MVTVRASHVKPSPAIAVNSLILLAPLNRVEHCRPRPDRAAEPGYQLGGTLPYDGLMMFEQAFRRHRARWALFAALLLASALSTLLVAARVIHTGRLTYAFLVYNLILAWIPLGFAAAADSLDRWRSRPGVVLTTLSAAAWLLFFPNAPYLMTDLMHLRVQNNRLFWLDLTALQAFAWTGLALGFLSLALVQGVVARRVGRRLSWVFASAMIGASAFGIYLGRFRRWNSWDIVLNPTGLLYDAGVTVLHPFANAHVVAYCAMVGSFLFTAYVVAYAWAGVREEPDRMTR